MTDRITFDQMEKLAEGKDKTIARMIELTCLAINSAEDEIRGGLDWITSTAKRIERALAEGQSLNSLGEFQRTPGDIDRAITLRMTHWQNLGHLIGRETAEKLARGEF